MQDHPRAPGIARQGTLGTDGPAACGGAAAQSSAPGQTRRSPRHAHAHAHGVGPHAVRHHAHAHAERAGSREPWPGACRPVGAAAHHPLAGLGAPAALGRLVPRRCHSRHPPCPPVHRPGRAGRRSGLCRLAGADPPAAHHREHGRPPAPPGARPTQDHPPKIYPWPGGRRGQAGGQGRPKYQPAPMSAARARR